MMVSNLRARSIRLISNSQSIHTTLLAKRDPTMSCDCMPLKEIKSEEGVSRRVLDDDDVDER